MANAPTPLVTRKKAARIEIETTKGTAITTVHYLQVYDLEIKPSGDAFQERQPNASSLSPVKGIIGERPGECSFKLELRSDGVDSLDQGIEDLLQCCGYSLATLVFSPESAVASQKTCTIDVWEGSKRKRLHGCSGDVKFVGEFGKVVVLEFSFEGVWNAPIDEAFPAVTLPSQPLIRLASATCTIGAYAPGISKIEFGLGCSPSPLVDVSTAAAITYYKISSPMESFANLDPQDDTVANHDFYGLWLAATEAALALVLSDGTVNVTVGAPKLQYQELAPGERDDTMIYDLTGQLNNSADAGDDQLTITTAAA